MTHTHRLDQILDYPAAKIRRPCLGLPQDADWEGYRRAASSHRLVLRSERRLVHRTLQGELRP